MLMTVYIVFATLWQWWQISNIRNILHTLWSSKNAFLLSRSDEIHAECRRKCIDRVMFFNNDRIACTTKGFQTIHLTSWRKFPTDLDYFPFLIQCKHVELNRSDIFFLMRCSLEYMTHENNIIQIEDYGELMAWRVIPHRFEVIVRSDMDNLARLVLRYYQNILHMNSVMEVIELETVSVKGQASEIFYRKKYTESERLRITYSPGYWRRFIRELTELYEQIPHHSNPEIKIESGYSRFDEYKRAAGYEARSTENKKNEDRNTLEVSGTRPKRSKPIDIKDRNNRHRPETSKRNIELAVTRESFEYKVEPETSRASIVEKNKSISVNPSCSRDIKSEANVKNKPTVKISETNNGYGVFTVDRGRNESSISNVKNTPSKPEVAVKREDLEHKIKPEKSEGSNVGKKKTSSVNQSTSNDSKSKSGYLQPVSFLDWDAEAKRTNGFFRVDHYRSPRAAAIRRTNIPGVFIIDKDFENKVEPEKSEASIVEKNKTSPNTSCNNAIKNEGEMENTQAVTCEDTEYKTEPEKSVDKDKTASLNTSKVEHKVEPEQSEASIVEENKTSPNTSCNNAIKNEGEMENTQAVTCEDTEYKTEPEKSVDEDKTASLNTSKVEHKVEPEQSEASIVEENKTSPNTSCNNAIKNEGEMEKTQAVTCEDTEYKTEPEKSVDKDKTASLHISKVEPEKSEASIVEENKTSPNTSCNNAIKNEGEMEKTEAVTCEDTEYKTQPEKSVDKDKTALLNTSEELKDKGKGAELSNNEEVDKDKLSSVCEVQICDEKISISTLEDKKPDYCDEDAACALSILVPDTESAMQTTSAVLDVPNCDSPNKTKTPSTPGKINTFANIESRMTSSQGAKPPNILVYGDTITAKENVKAVLNSVINGEKYIIYDLPTSVSSYPVWSDSTALVVICGATTPELKSNLLQYLISGGQLLCLCSDLLHSILTVFSTAEVREHELVRFSYGDWKRVKMMHHIFCYQASPAKKQFSQGSTESTNHSSGSSPVAPKTPAVAEINHNGKRYILQVQVLGTEETWQSPSLLLANMKNSEGRAIFSQVHLEIDPLQYEGDEDKFIALKESNEDRLAILTHILTNQLGIDCSKSSNEVVYTIGYFLGRHESVNELLKKCSELVDNKIDCGHVTMEFCEHGADPGIATSSRLPIMKYTNPPNFSTSHYFDTLSTEIIGRLVIYVDILKSSQYLLSKPIQHGLVVIPRQQTAGVGRSNNTWLSPLGSACFSLQLHIPLSSPLGRMLTIVQHLVIVAVVEAIKKHPGYAGLDIGIKWPNDIYLNKKVKIGGLIANSTIGNKIAVLNIGCGLNLDNKEPTRSLNDYIMEYSVENSLKLERLSLEKYFALVFNELENLYDTIQNDNIDCFFDLYYKNWIHQNSEVTIQTEDGETSNATIEGIDDFGFLKVRRVTGEVCVVQPDGNTFDMIKGLIAPKPKFN